MADIDLFTQVPPDIIFRIFRKLPTETLIQLRCVAKLFNSIITHPHFIKLHLSSTATATATVHPHHLIYYESVNYRNAFFSFHADKTFSLCKIIDAPFNSVNGFLRIVGSVKGIVCLFDTNYFASFGNVILWNPFIGKFKILPGLEGDFCNMAVGFGFDPRTVDFKVVKILYDCSKEHEFVAKAFVYEVKIGSWRRIELEVPGFMPKRWSSSVYVNGVVHWLANDQQRFARPQPNCVMGFDVVEEVFKLIKLPRNMSWNCNEIRLSHMVDEKSLVLFVSYRGNGSESWVVWLMNEYGNVESWIRKYTIVLQEFSFPLKMVNGGGILAAIRDNKLVLLDVEKQEVKDLEVCGLEPSFHTAVYMPSLALLDMGEQLVE